MSDANDQAIQGLIYQQALANGQGFLQGNLDQQNALGLNPQIQAAQNQGNLQQAQAGQGLLSQPAQVPIQNWQYDPNNSQAHQAQALIAAQPRPMDFKTPGQYQAAIRDHTAALDNANFWSKSSFYGGGNTQMDPSQLQAAQDKAVAQHTLMGNGLLQGAQQQQGVPMAATLGMADLAQKNLASGNLLAGDKYKTQAALIGEEGKNQTEIQKAQIGAKAETDKASIMAQIPKPASTAEMKAQDKADEANVGVQTLSDLANQFDPSFFTNMGQAGAKVSDTLGRFGIDSGTKPQGFDPFQSGLLDMGNKYVSIIGGPRGLTKEESAKRIMEPFANAGNDPQKAANAMIEFGAKYHVATALANAQAAEALARGRSWDRNSEDAKAAVKAKMDALDPNTLAMARQQFADAHPKLAQAAAGKADQIAQPASAPVVRDPSLANVDSAALHAQLAAISTPQPQIKSFSNNAGAVNTDMLKNPGF